jgi:hypothetical protein
MKDLEISGPVRLELFIKSSVVDTDFTGNSRVCGRTGSPKISPKELFGLATAIARKTRIDESRSELQTQN